MVIEFGEKIWFIFDFFFSESRLVFFFSDCHERLHSRPCRPALAFAGLGLGGMVGSALFDDFLFH